MGKENQARISVQEAVQVEASLEPADLDSLYDQKEPRLPKGVRSRIRFLKSQEREETDEETKKRKMSEILHYAELERAKAGKKRGLTKQEKATARLDQTIVKVLVTPENSSEEQEEMARAIWLSQAAGEIKSEERIEELGGIGSGLSAEKMTAIRKEVAPLLT